MKLRAAIIDLYKTLLDVQPPSDPDGRWTGLWQAHLQAKPRLSLKEFSAQADLIIAREHSAAKAVGVLHPEVYWPDVVAEVIPELAALPGARRDDFLFEQTRCWHTVELMPGAADVLGEFASRGVALGLASNCQPYTLRELDLALASAQLQRSLFQPSLCFFSFACGFSKPDPHVFRLLAARVRSVGLLPSETLIVGDREDNDIAPARSQGFQTWQLAPRSAQPGEQTGDWPSLAAWLRSPDHTAR